MLIEAIQKQFSYTKCANEFFSCVKSGMDASIKLSTSARPLFIATTYLCTDAPLFVLVSGETAAHKFAQQISAFVGMENVFEYRTRNVSITEIERYDAGVVSSNIEFLHELRAGRSAIFVMPSSLFVEKVAKYSEGFYEALKFKEAQVIDDIDHVCKDLTERGYERVSRVKNKGEFAFKGGALDIFPGNLNSPVRVDLFGDEVESVHEIFASTGQTISDLKTCNVYPVCEMPMFHKNKINALTCLERQSKTNIKIRELFNCLHDDIELDKNHLLLPYLTNTCSISEFLPSNTIVCVSEPSAIVMDTRKSIERLENSLTGYSMKKSDFVSDMSVLNFDKFQTCLFESLMLENECDSTVKVRRTNVQNTELEYSDKIKNWLLSGYKVLLSADEVSIKKQFEQDFLDNGIPFVEVETHLKSDVVNLTDTSLAMGMIIDDAKLVIISSSDFFNARKGYFALNNNIDITKITFPFKPGDYCVHATFGICYFDSLVQRSFDGETRDYMELHFAGNDKLYLPVEQFDRVTKYVGAEGDKPYLTRLDTKEWSKALNKARKATKKLAFDIVDVYARRASVSGYKFDVSDDMKDILHSTFAYSETPDQAAAIDDVFDDMQSRRVMDRLVCGDVGFGKTEVAIRAAYVAIKNGKQVILMCPTTILAQQHYETFSMRLEDLGCSVSVLSRFRTNAQQKKSLSEFASGKLDVLIGTHRLLSADVNPKDLGLVIVDEEQRFGVGHKEQLKNLRETIDVLTLSATPIPRTLQMSLSGVRELSLILTPPDKRKSVDVRVGAWDEDVVSDAIRFELARHGQVYYVANRVSTIDITLKKVSEIAPEANVGVAHGQMTKAQLEHVMEDFSAGIIDVLIATTIIESGIDNPNTNTLIIEDSHRLGLSQMYQLKGRVGRSSTQAYAYFMYPPETALTEEAQARLLAIDEHQELGSGVRIAMRDLEIRGAGNIFGAEQSGNMSAVGFDLFSQMLGEAVLKEKNLALNEGATDTSATILSDITINVPVRAYLSAEYIEDIEKRVLYYRKLAFANTMQEVDAIQNEVVGEFGELPDEAINLFAKTRLRALANESGWKSVSVVKGYLEIDNIDVPPSRKLDLRPFTARYNKVTKKLKIPIINICKGEFEILTLLEFLDHRVLG